MTHSFPPRRSSDLEAPGATTVDTAFEGPLTRVSFNDVSFSYSGDRINLQDVTLETPVPKRIALVGPSGSGKSTVINLLSRNYDVMSGSVMLNDTDIRDIGNQSLRSLMAVVNQDTTLRSEERRVGKECVSTCRSRGTPET